MKKLLVTFSFIAASFSAYSQVNKGTLAVGGSLGLRISGSSTATTFNSNTTTNNGPTTTSFEILPAAQYFLMDKLSIGVQIGYFNTSTVAKTTSTNAGGNFESINSRGAFVIQPMARYYYMLGDNFGVFGQLAIPLQFGSSLDKTTIGSTSTERTSPFVGVGVALSPGIVFFPVKKVGIEALFGNVFGFNSLTTTTSNNNVTTVNSSSNIDILSMNSFGLRFGFMYYFAQ